MAAAAVELSAAELELERTTAVLLLPALDMTAVEELTPVLLLEWAPVEELPPVDTATEDELNAVLPAEPVLLLLLFWPCTASTNRTSIKRTRIGVWLLISS